MNEEDYKLFQLIRKRPINNCIDLSKNMIGRRNGFVYFTGNFRIDFENKMSELANLQAEKEKKDKIIDKIQKEVREHIGFENRLKRDNREPDLFNQGRFYVANNINNILKGN